MKEFVTFSLLALAVGQRNASDIECEKKENRIFLLGTWKGCDIRSGPAINSPDVSITPRDETIEGLSFDDNKEIYYLPVKVAETFPNLIAYWAMHCSLTEVSKINFKHLSKLRTLSLHHNQIVTIASNTFDDLTSLEHLYLDSNKIKFINGEVFHKPNKLTAVWMQANICINEEFTDPTRITAMSQIVTQKCGFHENIMELLEKVLEAQKTNIKDFGERLEMQFSKTLTAVTQELRKTVLLKVNEIESWRADLQSKNEEINRKDLKIKILEERCKILNGQNEW